MRPDARERGAHHSVRSAIKARIGILSFEEFVVAENAQATADKIGTPGSPGGVVLGNRDHRGEADAEPAAVPQVPRAQVNQTVAEGRSAEPAAVPLTEENGMSPRERLTVDTAASLLAESSSDAAPETRADEQNAA